MTAHLRWADVEGSPGYLVSDLGRVASFVRVGPRGGRARILRPAWTSRGYLKVSLGRDRQAYVHELVAAAFVGPRPDGWQVDHVDHDRANNAAANLRYLPGDVNRWRWASGWRGRGEADPAEGARYAAMASAAATMGDDSWPVSARWQGVGS